MPTVVLGTLFSVAAVLVGKFWYLFMAVMMISGAGGDFTIGAKLVPMKEKDLMIVDHPYKCGFFALSKNYQSDQSNAIIDELTKVENTTEEEIKKKTGSLKALSIVLIFVCVGAFLGGLLFGYIDGIDDTEEPHQTEVTTTTESAITLN